MMAFTVTVRHGAALVIDSADFSYMLAATPGSHGTGYMLQSDPEAIGLDAIDDGGAATAEAGSGVLTRIELSGPLRVARLFTLLPFPTLRTLTPAPSATARTTEESTTESTTGTSPALLSLSTRLARLRQVPQMWL